ncbi:MAG: glycosyltransferase family 2 protein [Parasphingopyxis sp.]|uniref:glycosyltransferase family 2 protein n=1 Tax=Parasphingopyxis sp. TaxID=1920299 RepID=UPI0026059A8C|nr:glycosyltransferase family 2 protein [uncultured Parasphingopyxis sp.]
MKLVMTLLVRNEADIVRENIDFHLTRGVDHVVAIDNGSTDGTRDILSDYARQGLATVIDEPQQDHAQAEWVTAAALMARDELGADWILNNDADEFWLPPSGNLKWDLVTARSRKLICDRRHMFFAHDEKDDAGWLHRARYRIRRPIPFRRPTDIYDGKLDAPYLYLQLPPKALVSARRLRSISQGNHNALFEEQVEGSPSRITIYHFPIRSAAQFRLKVTQGGEAYLRNTKLPPGIGWHWRRWYRMLRTEGLHAALADALPSAARLQQDLRKGDVLRDMTMLGHLGGRQPAECAVNPSRPSEAAARPARAPAPVPAPA